MGFDAISLRGWWLAPLLSVAGLGASADLRLVQAVEKGDNEAVRSLLKQQVDVNTPQADGATALAWAAHWDDLETADLLIGAGANANAANDYGVTALSLAATNGSVAMVQKLLEAGADVNSSLPTGETVLMTAAGTGNVDVVKALLGHGADVHAKEIQGGQTALMWAVAERHPQVAQVLIEHGADVHARSKGGFTPLLFAAQQDDLDSARILLAAGADVNETTPNNDTLLKVAIVSGHEALSIFLLDTGADPNAADGDGNTALHFAMRKGITSINRQGSEFPDMLDLVRALLAHGANPNAGLVKNPGDGAQVDVVGATPFWLAAAAADVNAMHLLLEARAEPLRAAKGNTTPLMVAAGVGRSEDRTEEEERTALEAVRLLVELGSDVNAANEDGLTALHGAARTGENSIVQFLADKGARLDVQDKYGQTPLSIAQGVIPAGMVDFRLKPFGPHPSTASLLLELGATPPAAWGEATRGR